MGNVNVAWKGWFFHLNGSNLFIHVKKDIAFVENQYEKETSTTIFSPRSSIFIDYCLHYGWQKCQANLSINVSVEKDKKRIVKSVVKKIVSTTKQISASLRPLQRIQREFECFISWNDWNNYILVCVLNAPIVPLWNEIDTCMNGNTNVN